MERMINRRLQHFLESQAILKPYQSGFRLSHSTLDPLTVLESDASKAIQSKQYCIAVFLDITKAFDTVWHHGLLNSMAQLGLSGNLPCFIQNFLNNRSFKVRVQTSFSTSCTISKGVPQGSVISPTLFSIAINDVFNNCPQHFKYSLYADDGAFWVSTMDLSKGLKDAQQILDNLNMWAHQTGLQFATDKTKVLIFTNKKRVNPLPLSLNGEPLEYVSQFKFLGITFDKRLTWRPHIQLTANKCQPDLRLMKIISHGRWGADCDSLRKVYVTILRPKMEYGDFLFHTAAHSNLMILHRIQYAAARIILGVLKCTPVNTLEVEANIIPLTLLSKAHAVSYASRVLTIQSHPVALLLRLATCNDGHYRASLPIPSIFKMTSELHSLSSSPSHFACISLADRLTDHSFSCLFSMLVGNKDDLTDLQWRVQFRIMVSESYSSHLHIFTDGSLSPPLVGSAMWSEGFTAIARLQSSCSIFTAELYAIFIAINYISTQPHKYVIFSDSMSALQAINNPNSSSHHLVHQILKLISNMAANRVSIEWVPSHQGIAGNEKADMFAKQSLKLNMISYKLNATSDFKKYSKAYYINTWQTQYQNSGSPLYLIKPSIGTTDTSALSRYHQIILTRLRLNTTLITHKHYFSGQPRPLCAFCEITYMSVNHLLLYCITFSAHREILQSSCEDVQLPLSLATLLGDVRLQPALMKFLQDTELMSHI